MFEKILIANRGEIAVRAIRACRELGVPAVAIYSEIDRDGLHVRLADEAYPCGAAPARESYLDMDRVLDIARRAGADAIHPGYGFLSENGEFADRCAREGITFIGPRGDVIRAMGDKITSRRTAQGAGVPIVPGATQTLDDDEAAAFAREIGFPIMVKASSGGGGRGLRLVRGEKELAQALERARSEAKASFGDDALYVEKFVERPRHIEIQVLADAHGGAIHLFERECSIQRRHQKLIEEAPANGMTPELRERMGGAALAMVRAVDYVGAGTCEFLLDAAGEFYFLEMNTRIQVEHAVTEEITGVDIVKEMIRVAAGEPLGLGQDDVRIRGHAIEARVYAEDPDKRFLPSAGKIVVYRPPGGVGVRVDSGVQSGAVVSVHYDPMVAKLVAWGGDRSEAVARLERALAEFTIQGIRTSLVFHRRVVRHPVFRAGVYDTGFIDDHMNGGAASPGDPAEAESARRIARVLAAVAVHRRERAEAGWKRYQVAEKKGESLCVELRAAGDGRYEVRCGGDALTVDVAASAPAAESIIVDGSQFEATVDAKKADTFEVLVAGRLFRLTATPE
jgi:acetyl-CoA carboxylase biotin carboxylase subunit